MSSCALNLDTAALHIRRIPAGQTKPGYVPLVLLHGWGSHSDIWQSLLPHLNNEFELWLVDLPGFGLSAKLPFASVDGILLHLEQSLPVSSILLGWSLGGMLATQFAARYPSRVQALVTLATNIQFVSSDAWFNAMPKDEFEQFVKQFAVEKEKTWQRFCSLQARGDQQQRYVVKVLREQTSGSLADSAESWMRALECLAQFNNIDAFKSLDMPALHILGAQDALVPVSAAAEISSLEVSQHQVLILDNVGHAPQISQPERVAESLTKFLRPLLCQKNKNYDLEKSYIAQSFSKAAVTYDQAADLQRKVGTQLLNVFREHCDRGHVLDLGCGTGVFARRLVELGYSVLAVDIAQGMLDFAKQNTDDTAAIQWLCTDAETLSLSADLLDGVYSNLALQWCGRLPRVFRGLYTALKPGASLCFSTFGPRTLWQLREAWQQVDGYVHVNRFEPKAVVLQYLREVGFEDVQCTISTDNIAYSKLWHLLQELRALGAHNVNAGRNKGLTGKRRLAQLEQAYQAFYSSEQRGFMASYEIFSISARKPSGP